ncbi:MAG: protein kinase, partial [Clostridia bacterium]|nr:protein kinase [Clostridia bacterium]
MEIIKKFEPIFGEWYVESFIGAGSFGRVYKIYREELGERFYSALKYYSLPPDDNEIRMLRREGMDNESIVDYYTELTKDVLSESRLMSKLRGQTNVVSFDDSKVIKKPDGMGYDVFIRMELLTSLTARMDKGQLPPEEVKRLGVDICSALALCGKYSMLHRDIKPDNIFVNEMGDYKLGDFGIARQLEKTATFMSKKGTYNYMAPEIYKGEKYGATADIYSLGMVMYRLLNSGRLPFFPPAPQPIRVVDREDALQKRMSGVEMPLPRDGGRALGRIVLKACSFNPKDRYQSAEEMKADLENLDLAPAEKEPVAMPVTEAKPIAPSAGKSMAEAEATEIDFFAEEPTVLEAQDDDSTMGLFGKSIFEANASPAANDPASQGEETLSFATEKLTEESPSKPGATFEELDETLGLWGKDIYGNPTMPPQPEQPKPEQSPKPRPAPEQIPKPRPVQKTAQTPKSQRKRKKKAVIIAIAAAALVLAAGLILLLSRPKEAAPQAATSSSGMAAATPKPTAASVIAEQTDDSKTEEQTDDPGDTTGG